MPAQREHKRPTAQLHTKMFVKSIYRYLSLARLWIGPCVILDSLVYVRTCSPRLCVYSNVVSTIIWSFRLIRLSISALEVCVYLLHTERPTDSFIILSLFLARSTRDDVYTYVQYISYDLNALCWCRSAITCTVHTQRHATHILHECHVAG